MSVRRVCALILFLAVTAPVAAQPPAMPPPPNPPMTSPPMGPSPKATVKDGKTLYQRLGGYDAIAKTVDAFLPHLIANFRSSEPWRRVCRTRPRCATVR